MTIYNFSELIKNPTAGIKIECIDDKCYINVNDSEEIILIFDYLELNELVFNINNNCKIQEVYRTNIINLNIIYNVKNQIHFEHSVVNLSTSKQLHISREVIVEKKSQYHFVDVELANQNIEANITVKLAGIGASSYCRLGIISENDENKLFNINCQHLAKNTISHIDNFAICKNKSRCLIMSEAEIIKNAKHSQADQVSKIILFDQEARGEVRPNMIIEESEVDAGHSSSIGQIDQEHLFYMLSRGITYNKSRNLISIGYLFPVLEYLDVSIRKEVFNHIEKKVSAND